MSKKETFGGRLFNLRHDKRWTQAQLARKAGVSLSLIGAYEQDVCEPRLFTALCLADALGVSLDYLATGRTRR